MLDQLVALKVVGDSYSAVIAFLVQTQLQAMKRDYGLTPHADSANAPSTSAMRDGD
jgi:hypothetical protein